MKKINFFVSLLVVLSIFINPIYFAFILPFGSNDLDGSSSFFSLFSIAIFLSILFFFIRSFSIYRKVKTIEFIAYLFILFLIILHSVFYIILESKYIFFNNNFIFFIVLGLSGVMSARLIFVYDSYKTLFKITDFIILACAIIFSLSTFIDIIDGSFFKLSRLENYQAVSYNSAVCIGVIGLPFLLNKNNFYNYLITKPFLLLRIIITFFLIFISIINGGRGAFILVIIYSVIYFYKYLKTTLSKKFGLIKIMIHQSILGLLFYLLLSFLDKIELFKFGVIRVLSIFNLFDSEAIARSNRAEPFMLAVDGIISSPFIGYGPFFVFERVVHPHNIFLELILQFGIPFAFVVSFISLILIVKKTLNSFNTDLFWFIIVGLYPLVLLIFSTSYLRIPSFWFVFLSILYLSNQNKDNTLV